uniref:Myb/SANT-like DNA-binding domain-containing protein n=1 Tax=Oryza meridionalis TaxID=40149 RepID=A0A0E0DET6_9ORYZ
MVGEVETGLFLAAGWPAGRSLPPILSRSRFRPRPDLTHHLLGAGPSIPPAWPKSTPSPRRVTTGSPLASIPPPPHRRPQTRSDRSPNPAAAAAEMDDDDAAASASPSPSPSPVASALPVADPVTVAAGPPSGLLALALPIQKQQHAASPNPGGGGGREDAWSEGATAALIDAWGERFVALGRGSLRHPQWQEVADAVSSREGYAKAPKSDVQCKNRIDTLKKKYKIERAKPASSWQFFGRLDDLLAPTFNQKPGGNGGGGGGGAGVNGRNPVPAALRVGFPQRSRTPLMPAPVSAVKRRAPSPEPSASSESSDGFPPEREPAFPPLPLPPPPNGKRSRADEGRGGGGGDRAQGLRELAQAIRRFGEAYERVETAKLEQSAEMERRRLDFASELESQRVQFFLNTQMELSQSDDEEDDEEEESQ